MRERWLPVMYERWRKKKQDGGTDGGSGLERERKQTQNGPKAHLLSVCISMRHCGYPASQAVKVTTDYQDRD